MIPQKLNRLLNVSHHLGRMREDKYLMLDGSRFPDVYVPIYEMEDRPEYVPLFKGTYFESIMSVSPCLVRIRNCGLGLLPWFLEHGSTAEKGWIFTSEADMKTLAEHFRDCLVALLPDKRKVLFRFYDPAILQVVANCVNSETWLKISGPCSRIIWKYRDDFYEAAFDRAAERGAA